MTDQQDKDDKAFAIEAARIATECNCTDVSVIDLRGKSPATNFFVIATGTSPRQSRTVADEIHAISKEHDFKRIGQAGYDLGRWVLVDYVNVVIHIFDAEYRDYYDLELLWGDAEKLKIDQPEDSESK